MTPHVVTGVWKVMFFLMALGKDESLRKLLLPFFFGNDHSGRIACSLLQ